MIRRSAHARLLSVLPLVALALAACARNPVTGKRELALVSKDQEIALGKESAEQVKAQMGVYPDEKVQAYVREIGLRMAKASERPDLPWQFNVLDDATVNAFALPGGPVFITRGILTHFNSEAELASVLGHEIGHITARHSVEQLSKQQLAQLGLGVGMIVSPELAQFGQAAAAGLQLLFLKYGRDAERQADQLGFKYMGHRATTCARWRTCSSRWSARARSRVRGASRSGSPRTRIPATAPRRHASGPRRRQSRRARRSSTIATSP